MVKQTFTINTSTVAVSEVDTAPLTTPATTPMIVSQRETVLSVLRDLFGRDAAVGHHADGSPYVTTCPVTNVSISHCKEFVAIAADPGKAVGIDIEMLRPASLARVIDRILLPGEEVYTTTPEMMLAAWTLKEALYKALHCNGRASSVNTLSQIAIPAPGESVARVDGRTFTIVTLPGIGYAQSTLSIAIENTMGDVS